MEDKEELREFLISYGFTTEEANEVIEKEFEKYFRVMKRIKELSPKPQTKLSNSVVDKESLREEFCQATQWCELQKEKQELESEDLTEYETDESGIPIVGDTEGEIFLYREVREIIEKGYYKCPICNKSFNNIVDFQDHWKETHELKYGKYSDFRKYKYRAKDEELTEDESVSMLKLWLKAKRTDSEED